LNSIPSSKYNLGLLHLCPWWYFSSQK
jgi:hypothetical protein